MHNGSGIMGAGKVASHLIWVFLHVLDGLQDPQGLLYISAKGQIVDGGMLDHALNPHA